MNLLQCLETLRSGRSITLTDNSELTFNNGIWNVESDYGPQDREITRLEALQALKLLVNRSKYGKGYESAEVSWLEATISYMRSNEDFEGDILSVIPISNHNTGTSTTTPSCGANKPIPPYSYTTVYVEMCIGTLETIDGYIPIPHIGSVVTVGTPSMDYLVLHTRQEITRTSCKTTIEMQKLG